MTVHKWPYKVLGNGKHTVEETDKIRDVLVNDFEVNE